MTRSALAYKSAERVCLVGNNTIGFTMSELPFYKALSWRAENRPNDIAIKDWSKEQAYSWFDLKSRADALAAFFSDGINLAKGDRVGYLVDTDIALFDAFYASFRTGIILSTYNVRLIPDEILLLLENEEPKIVFYSRCYEEKAMTLKEKLSYPCLFVCVDSESPSSDYSYVEIVSQQPPMVPTVSLGENDPAMLIHTGGTTGIPKAAIISHKALFLSANSFIVAWGISERDIAYIAMPFFHVGGWNCPALGMLYVGATMIIAPQFSPQLLFEITEQERPSFFLATETMLNAISSHAGFADTDLSSYRWIMAGGSPITVETMKPYWEKGIRVLNGYGMTEIVAFVLASNVEMSLEENKRKLDSVGKPLPFSKIKLVNGAGEEVPPGEMGEIVVGGDLVFSGYWGDAANNVAVLEDGWVHTGDIGFQDEDGDYYVRGRKKEMFISGGENIFPIEVENVLASHPNIVDCAVVGIPDEHWGEVGLAFVVTDQPIDQQSIESWIDGKISSIKKPKEYRFVETIPKTGAGKKDLSALRRCI